MNYDAVFKAALSTQVLLITVKCKSRVNCSTYGHLINQTAGKTSLLCRLCTDPSIHNRQNPPIQTNRHNCYAILISFEIWNGLSLCSIVYFIKEVTILIHLGMVVQRATKDHLLT